MASVAILTDSNSGISVEEGKKIGVGVVPMPVCINGNVFYEGYNISQGDFYDSLLNGDQVSTSQPTPGHVMDTWDKYLEKYHELVYIPMSSGLSSSYHTATIIASEYDGRVFVVDNRRISMTQRYAVYNAMEMAKQGLSGAEIKAKLEEQWDDACIYISVDTLKYLQRGGRISTVEKIAGTLLNIKPVMEIRGEKLNLISKIRGMDAARKYMIQKVRDDISGRLKSLRDNGHLAISISYSRVSEKLKNEWWSEVCSAFKGEKLVEGDPLSLSIACHTGPGALGVGTVRI